MTMPQVDSRDFISVPGTGTASGPAELASVTVTVRALRASASEAVSAADALVRAIKERLAAFTNAVGQARTQSMQVRAEERYDTNNQLQRMGIKVEHSLAVDVTDLPLLGQVLSEVLDAGGDDIVLDDLRVQVREPQRLRTQARAQAFSDAKDRAQELAALAGRDLGEAVVIDETSQGYYGSGTTRVMALSAEPGLDVAPADVREDVSLVVKWALR